MHKLVLDTNVIISAIVFGGNPRIILEGVLEGKFEIGISGSMLEEIKGVLESKKFRFSPQMTHAIIQELISLSEFVNPEMNLCAVEKDPDDNRILECACEFGADFIISGDSHLLEIGRYKTTKIMNSVDFLQEIKYKNK